MAKVKLYPELEISEMLLAETIKALGNQSTSNNF